MKRSKGFTLIELLGVIVLLTLILLITFPVIGNSIRQGKKKADEQLKESIVLSAKNWSVDNKLEMPKDGKYTIVSSTDLENGGYIDKNLKMPSTSEIYNNYCVKINREKSALYYNVVKPCPDTTDAQVITTYSCPNGYNQSGSGETTSCSRVSKEYTASIYSEEYYSCPSQYQSTSLTDSYVVNGSSCIHQVIVTEYNKCSAGELNETTDSTLKSYQSKGYSCQESGSGDMEACYASGDNVVSVPLYSECTKTVGNAELHSSGYSCPSGYAKEGSGPSMTCYKNATQTTKPKATKSLNCPGGYDQIGSQENLRCVKGS